MIDAYSIGIRVKLYDGVSTGLAGITRKFAKAELAGASFHKQVDRINSALLKSGTVALAGFAGLGFLKHALKPATEYANQLSLINQLGLSQVETAGLVSAAWKTSHDVMTSSAAGNLKTLRELRSAFGAGHEEYAIQSLAPTQRMSGILTALTGKEQERIGFDVVKSIELRTPLMTSAAVNSNIAQMSQTVMGMGGTIDPHDYHLALKGAKSAALGWSDEFVYKYLPTIMQTTKAGRGGAGTAGVGLMSLSQATHGMVTKASIPYLEEGGLLDKKDVVRNATGQWQLKAGAIKGTDLFDKNPYQWGVQYLTPAVNKIMEKDHVSAVTAINEIYRNRNASFIALTLYMKQQQFERDAQLIKQANGINGYNALLKTNPELAGMALSKQWSNLLAIIGYQVMPKLIEGAMWLIPKIQSLTSYFKENAGSARKLVYGLGGLAGAMAIGGTISAAAWALKGLGLALSFSGIGGVAGIAGIAAALSPVGGVLLALAAAAGVVYAAYKLLPHGNDGAPAKPLMLTKEQIEKNKKLTQFHFSQLSPKPIFDIVDSWVSTLPKAVTGNQRAGWEPDKPLWSFDTMPHRNASSTPHVTVLIDGEDVRHRIVNNMPSSPSKGQQGVNPRHSPMSPGLNFAHGL